MFALCVGKVGIISFRNNGYKMVLVVINWASGACETSKGKKKKVCKLNLIITSVYSDITRRCNINCVIKLEGIFKI